MKTLIERITLDVKENPERIEKYLVILAKAGMLDGRTIKVKAASQNLLNVLNDTVVILKGGQ